MEHQVGVVLESCPELLQSLGGTTYLARTSIHNPANVIRTKKALKKAFEVQINNKGFSFVEFLSACPTNWKLSPQEANKRVSEEMIPYFPLGIFKEELE